VWAIRRELARFDAAYPAVEQAVLTWLQYRRKAAATAKAVKSEAYRWAVLVFTVMYVDDIGAASINDFLFDHRGERVMPAPGHDGTAGQQRRSSLHFAALVGVVKHFGHADSEGKSWLSGESMDFLGASLDLEKAIISTLQSSSARRMPWLSSPSSAVKQRPKASCAWTRTSSTLSATSCSTQRARSSWAGSTHFTSCARCGRRLVWLARGRKVVGQRAQGELLWWLARLRAIPPESCPLASRSAFPRQGAPGLLIYYADASRELLSPGESGYGGWSIIGETSVYFDGRWTDDEVRHLHINALELATMNFAAFTFLTPTQRASALASRTCSNSPTTRLPSSRPTGASRARWACTSS